MVEWGHGLAEDLADDRLEVTLSGEDVRAGAGRRPTATGGPGADLAALGGGRRELRAVLAIDTSTSAITVAPARRRRSPRQRRSVDARGHTEHARPARARRCLATAGRDPGRRHRRRRRQRPRPVHRAAGRHRDRAGLRPRPRDPRARRVQPRRPRPAASRPSVGEGEFLVATDARRKEVYWARVCRVAPAEPRVASPSRPSCRPADLPEDVRALPTAGRGPLLYPELFPHPVGGPRRPGRRRWQTLRCNGSRRVCRCRSSRSTCVARTPSPPLSGPSRDDVDDPARPALDRHRAVAALERELFPDDAWTPAVLWAELAARPRRSYVVRPRTTTAPSSATPGSTSAVRWPTS